MSLLTDSEIINWATDYGGADTNSPASTALIGGDNINLASAKLAEYYRLTKTVARKESKLKEWTRYGHTVVVTGATTFTITSAVDLSTIYSVRRRICAKKPASTDVYGMISASSYGAGTQTVTVILDSGALNTGTVTEVYVGSWTAWNSNNGAFGVDFQAKSATILAGTSSIAVTWDRTFPDANYFTIATINGTYNAANPGESAAWVEGRTTTGCTLKIFANATNNLPFGVMGVYNPQ